MLLLASACARDLSHVDLESLLIRPDDLPDALVAGPAGTLSPASGVVWYSQAARQELFAAEGETAGTVTVYLFQSRADRDEAYDLFSLIESQEGVVPYPVPTVSESARARRVGEGIGVVFVRCHAVAVIWLSAAGVDAMGDEGIARYAQQLDQRLTPEVCP